jgi:hypothetical protein
VEASRVEEMGKVIEDVVLVDSFEVDSFDFD